MPETIPETDKLKRESLDYKSYLLSHKDCFSFLILKLLNEVKKTLMLNTIVPTIVVYHKRGALKAKKERKIYDLFG